MSNSKKTSQPCYVCNFCNYNTCKKNNYERHLLSAKHKKFTNIDNNEPKLFKCICGKEYTYRQSLHQHKKKCFYEKDSNLKCEIISESNHNNKLEDLIFKLVEENNDFKEIIKKQQDQISELIPKVGNITTNNNTTNNNKFNINVFLNEQCKDAMSINEFVHKIQISIKNLLTTKSKGIGIGINQIINENMNKLSVYERPIHCTDKKREILYIKNDTWEKDVDKSHTTNMLKALQSQQFKAMKKWQEANPNYKNDDELKHDYMILVNKCSSSLNDHEKKLFKNICDSTYIKDEVAENI